MEQEHELSFCSIGDDFARAASKFNLIVLESLFTSFYASPLCLSFLSPCFFRFGSKQRAKKECGSEGERDTLE